ncbi:MAG: transposase [Patescibacteria group bacterium]
MRVEASDVGDYVHVLKRGARGLNIVEDDSDRWRFLRLLYYMNDGRFDRNWERVTSEPSLTKLKAYKPFARFPLWPKRKPIVKILAYTLMPNHFHLLLKEITKGGISKFMQRIGQSMTERFNEKSGSRGKGSIFQGSYKARTVNDDIYLRYLASYIMVKNVFELYPNGGLVGASKNFEDAWQWAIKYPFGSLADYCGDRKSVLIDKDILGEIFTPSNFKRFAKDVILGGKWIKNNGDSEFARLAIE